MTASVMRCNCHEGGTIAERLGTVSGARVWVGGHAARPKRELNKHLDGTLRPPTGPIDVGLITPQTVEEAAYFARKLLRRLEPGALLWVVFPAVESEELSGAVCEIGFIRRESLEISPKDTAYAFVARP